MSRPEISGAALPDRPSVSVTEVVTWILDGRALTDEDINVARANAERQDQARWGSPWGPGWLMPCLAFLKSNPKADLSTIADDDLRRDLPDACNWLEARALYVSAAYEQVNAEISDREVHATRLARLYGLLFNASAAERWEMEGVLHQPNPHRVHIPHTVIPAQYFNDPTYHIMGKGYYGNGQVGPDLSARQTFDSLFSDRDDAAPLRRPIYVLVRIRRSDALELKAEFDRLGPSPCSSSAANLGNGKVVGGPVPQTVKAQTNCRKYIIDLILASPDRRSAKKDDIFEKASAMFPGLSVRAFDRAWTEAIATTGAHAWSRAGAPRKIIAPEISAAT
jgi:hypothetical protein